LKFNVPERVEYTSWLSWSVGAEQNSKISGQLLHSGRRRCQSTSTISQPAPLDRSAVSS